MTRSPARILAALLCLLACSALPVPPVTAWDPCASWAHPQLDFTATVFPTETFPVTVQLNASYTTRSDEPIVVWQWDFGDGTTDSIVREEMRPGWQSTRHVYTTLRDTVEVCAEGTTNCGITGHRCRQVEPYCTAPVAGFAVNVSEGPVPLAIAITDTSEHTPGGATTWTYTKDGGSTLSRARDFRGTFTEPGEYSITQTVRKNCNPRIGSFSRRIRVTGPTHGTVTEIGGTPTATPAIITGVLINLSGVTLIPTTPAAAIRAEPQRNLSPGTRAATPAPQGTAVPPATAAPPSFATGTLRVTTEPPGAEVYVDGVLRGASPASVPGLATGTHTLTIAKQGYKKLAATVEIEGGGTSEYATALVPASGGNLPLPVSATTVISAIGCAAGWFVLRTGKTR